MNMKNPKYNIFIFLAAVIIFALCMRFMSGSGKPVKDAAPQLSESITVFAAAGTTAAMQDIAAIYEQINGVKVHLNLASSSVLAKQIAAGADWDVFISANHQWMDYVLKAAPIDENKIIHLLSDQLALIAPADAKDISFSIDDPSFAIHFEDHLSLGDPACVPAGIYAKQTLEKLGWWQYLSDNVIPAVDVAAAQRYVEAGQCRLGIVYLSGVKNSSKVKILHVFDETLHDPIYFIAVSNSERGKQFLDFISKSAEAAGLFKRHGFEMAAQSSDSGG